MTKRDGGIVYEKLVWNDEELFDTQTNQPTDDLREIFKAIFGERDVWEVIDRQGNKQSNRLTPTQKKMFLKLVCDGKYTESDLIFIRAVEDFSSGFAFTRDAFCYGGDLLDYQTPSSKYKMIPYEKITSIDFGGYSSDWAEKKVPTLRINFKDDASSYYGAYNADDIFFNAENVQNHYTTHIITERILWQIGKFLKFVKA